MNLIRLKPKLGKFRGIFRLPGENKNKSLRKLTVVMCCHIVDRKSVAPSSRNFLLRPAPALYFACIFVICDINLWKQNKINDIA